MDTCSLLQIIERKIDEETKVKLVDMFEQILQIPFEKVISPQRKSLSYAYVIHKLLIILGKYENK